MMIIQLILFFALLGAGIWLHFRICRLEREFMALIKKSEKVLEQEARWNEGLNNILNYSLEDAFKTGGELK